MTIERIQAEMIVEATCTRQGCIFAKGDSGGDLYCEALGDSEVVGKLTSCGGTGCSIAAREGEPGSRMVQPGLMFQGRFIPVGGLQNGEDYSRRILRPEPDMS